MENNKVKLLCSYGGKIQQRPSDHNLTYTGGDTKILAIKRSSNFLEILSKLTSIFKNNNLKNNLFDNVSIKYQLPGEDLDALVSLIDDEDVDHMMIEYDRMQINYNISNKPPRLRLFIFDKVVVAADVMKMGTGNPDYLFGFDKEYQPSSNINGPPSLDVFNYGLGNINGNVGHVGTGQVVYRVPAGVYQSGGGYGFVPVMTTPVQDQRMMVVAGTGNINVDGECIIKSHF